MPKSNQEAYTPFESERLGLGMNTVLPRSVERCFGLIRREANQNKIGRTIAFLRYPNALAPYTRVMPYLTAAQVIDEGVELIGTAVVGNQGHYRFPDTVLKYLNIETFVREGESLRRTLWGILWCMHADEYHQFRRAEVRYGKKVIPPMPNLHIFVKDIIWRAMGISEMMSRP